MTPQSLADVQTPNAQKISLLQFIQQQMIIGHNLAGSFIKQLNTLSYLKVHSCNISISDYIKCI